MQPLKDRGMLVPCCSRKFSSACWELKIFLIVFPTNKVDWWGQASRCVLRLCESPVNHVAHVTKSLMPSGGAFIIPLVANFIIVPGVACTFRGCFVRKANFRKRDDVAGVLERLVPYLRDQGKKVFCFKTSREKVKYVRQLMNVFAVHDFIFFWRF